MRATLAIPLALLGSLPQASARAAPATACHCFTSRTFDPQQPAAADPYILATARSSVLSAAFSVPKAALARGGSIGELAGVAVDDVLATHLAADPSVLAALRKAGSSSPEAILSTLLSPRLRVPPTAVLARFQSGKVSWGMLLEEAGVKPKEIDGVVRNAMR